MVKIRNEWVEGQRRSLMVDRRITVRLRRCEQERGPAADGRWRETLVTQQSTLTGWLLCTLGAPPLCMSLSLGRPGPTSARTAGFMLSVPALRRTHTGHPATALQLPGLTCSPSVLPFLPLHFFLTALTGFHQMPTTCMCLWACNVHGSLPPYS